MYPLNDNDLDRLSREAADQYDVEPHTSGWEALEHRLNKELPPKEDKERRRFLFWLFLIVLLSGGGVLWMMTNKDRPATVQFTGANKGPAMQEERSANENKPEPATATDHNSNKTATASADQPTAATVQQGTTLAELATGSLPAASRRGDDAARVPQHNSRNRKAGFVAAPQSAAPINARGTKNVPVTIADRGRNTVTVPADGVSIQGQPRAVIAADPTISDIDRPATGAAYKDPAPSLVQDPGDMAGALGIITAPAYTPVIENKEKAAPLERIKEPRGWEVSVLAGPDLSNVGFTDVDKVGYNVGAQVAYRFNNRWSVNTGLIYTRKNYTAQGKDFTKPNNNYWNNADVKQVSGDCVMFDIPLNVRYDLSLNKKTRWFVSAGASSYIMTNQNYLVNYEYNGSPRVYPHEEYGTSSYLFSIVNFSVGFETKLNKRLSLQAEPYFKLPTKGLGYGKLDLNSYGLYFSLRYQLHK
ncbi:porin family protein [Paraflavitalea pollutisoli]|uniref:porin family protein n=1 Tax=Paraflavitalea pollutisoli TaxID=3034143 RepID=UPI0023ECDC9D|nr:porin family protein [Paraflavitalea sp. H1-2-19X]